MGSWSPCSLRHLNEGKLGEVKSLFWLLVPTAVRSDMNDSVRERRKNGRFSVNSLKQGPMEHHLKVFC